MGSPSPASRRSCSPPARAPAERRPSAASAGGSGAAGGAADPDRLPAEGHRQPVLRGREDRHRQGRRGVRLHGHPGRPERAEGGPAGPVHQGPDDPEGQLDHHLRRRQGRGRARPEGGHGGRDQGRRLRLQPRGRRLQRLRQPGRLQRRRRQPRRLGLRARPELHRRHRDPVGGRHGDQPERVDRPDEEDPRDRRQVQGPQARRHRLRRRQARRQHDAGAGPADQVPEPQGHRRADHGRHPGGGPGRLRRPRSRTPSRSPASASRTT